MEELLRELEKSVALRQFLRSRSPKTPDGPGCAPNCKWILEDLEKHGKLTGYPLDGLGGATYPVDGKLRHIAIELGFPIPVHVEDAREVLPLIVNKLRHMIVEN